MKKIGAPARDFDVEETHLQDSLQCMLKEPQVPLVTDCRSAPLFLVGDQWNNRITEVWKYTNFGIYINKSSR
jgi:hypothetical protein